MAAGSGGDSVKGVAVVVEVVDVVVEVVDVVVVVGATLQHLTSPNGQDLPKEKSIRDWSHWVAGTQRQLSESTEPAANVDSFEFIVDAMVVVGSVESTEATTTVVVGYGTVPWEVVTCKFDLHLR